jgi:hypothetical protein
MPIHLPDVLFRLTQSQVEALVSLHKSWDGIAPELLPEDGNLSTKAIPLLETLSSNSDSLTAYKLLREAIYQRYKPTTASVEGSSVTSPDVQSVPASHPFAPTPQNNPSTPRPRMNSVAKSSVRPTVEAYVPAWSNRSRSSSTEIDDDALRAHIARQMLSVAARTTSQKRPLGNNHSAERDSKRMKSVCSDSEDDYATIDKSADRTQPLPSNDSTIRNLMRLDRICRDSDDECAIVDEPAILRQPIAHSDYVEQDSKRAKSVSLDSEEDDEFTIVVDVSRLEDERRLREQEVEELSRRKWKSRKPKSKVVSSSVPKSRGKSKKS